MVRLAWHGEKQVVAESDEVIELEEFLRSVAAIDDGHGPAQEGSGGKPNASPPLDDIDDALEALDEEALDDIAFSDEFEVVEAAPQPVNGHAHEEAREISPIPEIHLPAIQERLSNAVPTDAASEPPPLLLVPDQRSDETSREAPPFEPRPHQVDELLDEALSETFPASDPIAVSTVH
jgi:hypothetical protein